jgi:hypothetical protein
MGNAFVRRASSEVRRLSAIVACEGMPRCAHAKLPRLIVAALLAHADSARRPRSGASIIDSPLGKTPIHQGDPTGLRSCLKSARWVTTEGEDPWSTLGVGATSRRDAEARLSRTGLSASGSGPVRALLGGLDRGAAVGPARTLTNGGVAPGRMSAPRQIPNASHAVARDEHRELVREGWGSETDRFILQVPCHETAWLTTLTPPARTGRHGLYFKRDSP